MVDNTGLKICHWNCRSIKNKMVLLPYLIDKHNIDILCLSETFLKEEDSISYPDFNVVTKCREDQLGGGLAVFIRKNLKFKVLDQMHADFSRGNDNNGVEFLLLEVKRHTEDRGFHILSIYSPPRSSGKYTNNKFWKRFFNFAELNFNDIVIVGDFNAKSDIWQKNVQTDIEGKKIEDALIESSIVCLNDNEFFTWRLRDLNHWSSLDLAFTSVDLALISRWTALDFGYDSDHAPCLIHLNCEVREEFPTRPSLVLKGVDWSNFRKLCEELADEIGSGDQISIDLDDVSAGIEKALLEVGAKKKTSRKITKKPCYWWDEECSEIIQPKIDAYHAFLNSPTIDNLNAFEEIKKETNKLLRKRKKEKYREFCESLSRDSNIRNVWRTFRNFKSRKLSEKGTDSSVDVGTARRAFDKLAHPEQNAVPNLSHLLSDQVELQDNEEAPCLLDEISWDEFKAAWSASKKGKAPGPDLFSTEVLSQIPNSLKKIILKCFNEILKSGVIPN